MEEEEEEEEVEEEGEKMKKDRFCRQPSKTPTDSSLAGRNVEAAAGTGIETQSQTQGSPAGRHGVRAWALSAVTPRAEEEHARGEPSHAGAVSGHSSLPRAAAAVLLRRPRPDQGHPMGRRSLSMYGEFFRAKRWSQSAEEEEPLHRPRSVCMLAAGAATPSLGARPQPGAGVVVEDAQAPHRSRKAELRAVDGLKPLEAYRLLISETEPVTPRVRQKSWRPRPVSMTVLELKKKSSADELGGRPDAAADTGGFFNFRWRLFGKAPSQDRDGDSNGNDKDPNSLHRSGKMEAPKKTLGSLRRSLSLRIRRNHRPKESAVASGSAGESTAAAAAGSSRPPAAGHEEETAVPPRPFSYLTGRTLPPRQGRGDDPGMQYIQYHSQGRVKVMEVPLYPAKLSGKPAQEEASIWQLITNRFRRKEQPSGIKPWESQRSQCRDTGQYPLVVNKSPPVAIEMLTGTTVSKGQGKARLIYLNPFPR